MSRDIGPEQDFQHSVRDSSVYYSNAGSSDTGSDWTSIHRKVLDTGKSLTQPCRIEQLLEDLPEMLQQLHAFEPLRTGTNQRQLARKALIALKNRQNEDFTKLANRIASDIAGAVD
jgi:hypothetical protein